jgi:phosphatidate cytidylyltransferase
MVRERVAMGVPLAAVIFGPLLLDGHLSADLHAWRIIIAGQDIGPWLRNGTITTTIALILTILTTRELVRLARACGYRPFAGLAQVFGAGLVVGPYVALNVQAGARIHDESWGMLWLACALGVAFLLQGLRRGTERAMAHLASTLFILFYAGGLAGFIIKLRMEVGGPSGLALILFSLILVKMTDTGAFFTGVLFGRHKMIPWLSPKKTWEGFAGGIVVTVICALAIGTYLRHLGYLTLPAGPLAYPWGLVIFGLLMAIFSVAGDLAASLLKRDAAVKDSGGALPGLGGILDIFDSPLLAAPPAWFFWTRVVPLFGPAAG